jgi:hypothetical protein
MKCVAMRAGATEASLDRQDIQLLAKALKIRSARDALALVSKYYPDNRIAARTQFGIEELFGRDDDH